MPTRSWTSIAIGVIVVALFALPFAKSMVNLDFVFLVVTRILILAAAAVSLNLIMGYGQLGSLGHAAFIGIGTYVVGICAYYAANNGVDWAMNGFLELGLTILLSAGFALLIGLVSLRTRGIYFLMITLAFGQMMYLAAVGAYQFGGDDGMTMYVHTEFDGVDLGDKRLLYYIALLYLGIVIYAVHRIVSSRFGLAFRAAGQNEVRAAAAGNDVTRVRLAAFVIAGVMASLAGMLLANFTEFVSPATMHWSRSGDLMIMVILGGLGTMWGPVLGAAILILLEQVLSSYLTSWQLVLGIVIILLARYATGGLASLRVAAGPLLRAEKTVDD